MNTASTRLITVSNRLPIVLSQAAPDAPWDVRPGAGGLVTALAPVLRGRGGIWIGWPGVAKELAGEAEQSVRDAGAEVGYELEPVGLTLDEVEQFYRGFANGTIWPLFHDQPGRCTFRPEEWRTYRSVNRRFAETVVRFAEDDDLVWIHDYHLMHVGESLRDLGYRGKTGFFLHIPFPPLDIFLRLPWRFDVLKALLSYDLVGFQTLRDRRNFVHCVRRLLPELSVFAKGRMATIRTEGRQVRIGAFPISIDFHEFADAARSPEVQDGAWYVHEDLPERQIILGVDRLDYSKGIPERLRGFRNALRRYPELLGNVTLVQIAVPSRSKVGEYERLKREIDRLVGEINGEFTLSGWVPIHYRYRSLDRTDLLSYYRACEVALVTPLKDGMNLVAKEYCAANADGQGVLILSEFAGAAAELKRGALIVNPHDEVGLADTIHRACTMPVDERRRRMKKLRRQVRRHDIFQWVDSFLQAAFAIDLDQLSPLPDFIPSND